VTPAFHRALSFTLAPEIEGGYSNHPKDRGGVTMNGYTQRLYDTWRTTTGRPKRSVELIDENEKVQIAYDEFWTPCNCEALPEPLSHAVFDMAFNSGTWNAKLTLQRALRVRADGVIGPLTIKAAKETPDAVLAFLKRRGAFIQEVILTRPDQVVFLEGWFNRILIQAWRYAK
jgi:lysozyme family protein